MFYYMIKLQYDLIQMFSTHIYRTQKERWNEKKKIRQKSSCAIHAAPSGRLGAQIPQNALPQ